MKLDILLLFLFVWSTVKGGEIQTCNNPVTISCASTRYKIVIDQVTPISSLSPDLLRKCNGHQRCDVENSNNECLHIGYWCRMNKFFVLDLKGTSLEKMTSSRSLFGLRSEDYLNGSHQKAKNLTCEVQTTDHGNLKQMNFLIHELAPFNSFTEFCLSVKESLKPPICSGSQNLYVTYGPFTARNKWQFSLSLPNTPNVPEVRFWFDIEISRDAEGPLLNHMNCYTQKGVKALTHEPTYGSTDEPTYGSKNEHTYGSTDEPSYGSTDETTYGSKDEPSYGSTLEPTYGSADKPTYGSKDGSTYGPTTELTKLPNFKSIETVLKLTTKAMKIIVPASVLGGFLLLGMVSFILLRCFWCSCRKKKTTTEDPYMYIDLDSMGIDREVADFYSNSPANDCALPIKMNSTKEEATRNPEGASAENENVECHGEKDDQIGKQSSSSDEPRDYLRLKDLQPVNSVIQVYEEQDDTDEEYDDVLSPATEYTSLNIGASCNGNDAMNDVEHTYTILDNIKGNSRGEKNCRNEARTHQKPLQHADNPGKPNLTKVYAEEYRLEENTLLSNTECTDVAAIKNVGILDAKLGNIKSTDRFKGTATGKEMLLCSKTEVTNTYSDDDDGINHGVEKSCGMMQNPLEETSTKHETEKKLSVMFSVI